MNAISSSVNKGAIKVAPKTGTSRRPRAAISNLPKATKAISQGAQADSDRATSQPVDLTHISNGCDAGLEAAEQSITITRPGAIASPGPHISELSHAEQPVLAQRSTQRSAEPGITDDGDVVDSRSQADDGLNHLIAEVSSLSGQNLQLSEVPGPETSPNIAAKSRVKTVTLENFKEDTTASEPHSTRQATRPVDEASVIESTRAFANHDAPGDTEAPPLADEPIENEDRKPTPRRKRALTPDDAEEQIIDTRRVKMFDLCRDLRTGRKSSKYIEFEKIAAQKRRRKRANTTEQPAEVGDTNIDDDDVDDSIDAGQREPDFDTKTHGVGNISTTQVGSNSYNRPPRVATGAPQVRVVNGLIVLDVNSLQVDRTIQDAAGEDIAVEYVEENPLERVVNSRSYSKSQSTPRWDALSTEMFYDGLSLWGTDFEMISKMFPTRTRKQIKNKFTLEERRNPTRLKDALIHKKPIDMDEYSRISAITFRPLPEMNHEIDGIGPKFEAERQEALKAVEQRKADEEPIDQVVAPSGTRRSRKKRADDGLELVGTIEEVEEQARAAAEAEADSEDEGEEEPTGESMTLLS